MGRLFDQCGCVAPDDQGPPTINVVADPNPAAMGGSVLLTANVDDSTTGGSNIASAEYSLAGAAWTAIGAQDGAFDEVSEDVTTSLPVPGLAGVYNLCVRGTDAADNIGDPECIMLVVYDPEGGFVTGGGWIDSPAGAYTAGPGLMGKANFGFVSKYKKGASEPTGNTEFQFKAGGLNFRFDHYDWLVIAGARAKYKGTGTVNGGGNYGFMLTATDAALTPSSGDDLFHIKIWDLDDDGTVIYDNKLGEADASYAGTAIGGGSIVIHKPK